MNKVLAGMLTTIVAITVLAGPARAADVAQRSFANDVFSFRVQATLLDNEDIAQAYIDAMETEILLAESDFEDVAFVDVAKPTAFGDYTKAIEGSGPMYGSAPGTAAVIYVRLGNVGLIGWIIGGPDAEAYAALEAIMNAFVPVTCPDGSVQKPVGFVPEGTGAFRYLPTEREVGMELQGEWVYEVSDQWPV